LKQGDLDIFKPTDDISGTVSVVGKKLEHMGIKVELFGVIEMDQEKTLEFTSSTRELSPASTIEESQARDGVLKFIYVVTAVIEISVCFC
jgi:hypothetical protein